MDNLVAAHWPLEHKGVAVPFPERVGHAHAAYLVGGNAEELLDGHILRPRLAGA
jgi:hypothetical protein